MDFIEILIGITIIIGAAFTLVGSIGLYKLPNFYMRLHGPTKASTLGVGFILISSSIYFTTTQGALSLHELLVTLFLFITAPIGAMLMAKAAIHLKTDDLDKIEKYQKNDSVK